MTKPSRVRINLGKKPDAEAKPPASRVRVHLRDETPKEDKPTSRVRINWGGKTKS